MGQRLVLSIKNNGEEVMNIYYHWSAYTFASIDELKSISASLSSAGVFDWQKEKLSDDDILELVKSISFQKGLHPIVVSKDLKILDGIDISTFTSRIKDDHPDVIKSLSNCKSTSELFQRATDAIWENDKFNPTVHSDIEKVFPEILGNRNCGLISINQESREYNDSWAEGTASIDIYTKECWTDCFWLEEIDIEEEYANGSILYTIKFGDEDEEPTLFEGKIPNFPEYITVDDLEWFENFIDENDEKLVNDGKLYRLRII